MLVYFDPEYITKKHFVRSFFALFVFSKNKEFFFLSFLSKSFLKFSFDPSTTDVFIESSNIKVYKDSLYDIHTQQINILLSIEKL